MRSTLIPFSGSPGATGGEWRAPRLLAPDVSGISPNERDILASADVIFCEQSADAGSLACAAPRAFIEQVRGSDPAQLPAVSIDRARRLADDGWRVVWLASADRAGSLAHLQPANPGAAGGGSDPAAARAYEPHRLATAFNGLAG